MTQNPPRVLRRERFTLLEPSGPNALTAEQQTWPVIPLADESVRFTPLESKGPTAKPESPPPAAVDAADGPSHQSGRRG